MWQARGDAAGAIFAKLCIDLDKSKTCLPRLTVSYFGVQEMAPVLMHYPAHVLCSIDVDVHIDAFTRRDTHV